MWVICSSSNTEPQARISLKKSKENTSPNAKFLQNLFAVDELSILFRLKKAFYLASSYFQVDDSARKNRQLKSRGCKNKELPELMAEIMDAPTETGFDLKLFSNSHIN